MSKTNFQKYRGSFHNAVLHNVKFTQLYVICIQKYFPMISQMKSASFPQSQKSCCSRTLCTYNKEIGLFQFWNVPTSEEDRYEFTFLLNLCIRHFPVCFKHSHTTLEMGEKSAITHMCCLVTSLLSCPLFGFLSTVILAEFQWWLLK